MKLGFVGNCRNIYVLEEAYYHYIEDEGLPGEDVPMHRCVREPSNVNHCVNYCLILFTILTLKVDNNYLKYLYKMLDINFKCINTKGINHNA